MAVATAASDESLADRSARRLVPDARTRREMEDPSRYERLCHMTAVRWERDTGQDVEDLRQELSIVAWRARLKFDATRVRGGVSDVAEAQDRYVFMCVRNKVKDLVRNSYARRRRARITYIEDESHPSGEEGQLPSDSWELRHLSIDDEMIYAPVVEGTYMVPPDVTEFEGDVLRLLLLDFSQTEIARRMGVGVARVRAARSALVQKWRRWDPAPGEPARLLQGRPRGT